MMRYFVDGTGDAKIYRSTLGVDRKRERTVCTIVKVRCAH
jgi:hypothetical protein